MGDSGLVTISSTSPFRHRQTAR